MADTVPDHLALVYGERRFTFAQLDERANRLAHALMDRGVRPGEHVALYLYNSNEYLEGMLAAFKLRAVPINVNYRYVEDELRYLLDDSDSVAVIFDDEFASRVHKVRPDVPALHTVLARSEYETALAHASPARDFPDRSSDDLYLLYTGGSTGMPKGVMWRHEDVFFGAMGGAGGSGSPITSPDEISERCREPRTRCVPACPFMHGTAHWMALGALFVGGCVIVPTPRHLEPLALWQLIARENANFLVIIGDAFARPLLDALDTDDGRALDVSSLRVLLSGGAILSPALKSELIERLPETLVVDGYGASETGGQGSSVVARGADAPGALRFRVGPDTAVLDDDLLPAPPGVVGLLARRGHIPLGYYKDPDKTATTFPVVDGVRWAVPGDHAYVDEEGFVTLLGRGSVSINTGGEKVYPEEVEAVLKGHPAVFDVVVVGVPDERWGERIVAVVQARQTTKPSLETLRAHAHDHLAGYKAPRGLVLVDTIERSPSGKPDYRWAKSIAMGTFDS